MHKIWLKNKRNSATIIWYLRVHTWTRSKTCKISCLTWVELEVEFYLHRRGRRIWKWGSGSGSTVRLANRTTFKLVVLIGLCRSRYKAYRRPCVSSNFFNSWSFRESRKIHNKIRFLQIPRQLMSRSLRFALLGSPKVKSFFVPLTIPQKP